MNYLYLILDLATLFFPVVLSFDKRVHFVSEWKSVLLSTVIVAVPFIIWDITFTERGVWGFNPDYLTGIYLGNLPLEEVLFFIVVPFACTFIYACCRYYFRNVNLRYIEHYLPLLLFAYCCMLPGIKASGLYTIVVVSVSIPLIIIWMRSRTQYIAIAFLFSLIPFLLMNGTLTGYFTDSPVVWYNEAEKVPYRLLTIPLEDILYAFTLIVSTILVHEQLSSRLQK